MPELWELTDEEAAEEARLLEDELRAADRADASMYSEMHALLQASNEELDALPPDEAEYVRRYRSRCPT